MKTQSILFLLAIAMIGFISCDKSDLAINEPGMNELTIEQNGLATSAMTSNAAEAQAAENFEIDGIIPLQKYYKKQNIPTTFGSFRPEPPVVSYRGRGNASSSLLNKSNVTFDMDFNKLTFEFSGTVKYFFPDEGDELNISFSGTGPFVSIPDSNGPNMGLVASVNFVSGTGRFEDPHLSAVGYLFNAEQILNSPFSYVENFVVDGLISLP